MMAVLAFLLWQGLHEAADEANAAVYASGFDDETVIDPNKAAIKQICVCAHDSAPGRRAPNHRKFGPTIGSVCLPVNSEFDSRR